jgi:PHD/YefM family antitoxin component YafN of YafNO toxin-antitoxin module
MLQPKERYIVDENGQRVGVVLDIEDYQRLLEELEELEAIRAYDAAKASGDEMVPLDQALAEIDKDRP